MVSILSYTGEMQVMEHFQTAERLLEASPIPGLWHILEISPIPHT